NLYKDFIIKRNFWGKAVKTHQAIHNFSFTVFKGETLGLVGESGCGKTTLGRVISMLTESSSGTVEYNGTPLNILSAKEIILFRKNIQFIFQDPYSSLNPKFTIGDTLLEPLTVHKLYKNKKERIEKVYEILEKVRLEKQSFYKYPHEFSGGQRQRIVIARALILQPELIICDESVSALDVSIQAEILNLLNDIKAEFNLTYIFISHDLSVVKYMSDRIMVMSEGKLIEINKAEDLYKSPASEYTRSLINAIPQIMD
ncbi:MAG TPA: ATP-binding cassette domain-containing protein, partial [Bacteroidales bacterium]|nr:ATP-binding cassette domain-containing protein [Bacteroidales bacterium]